MAADRAAGIRDCVLQYTPDAWRREADYRGRVEDWRIGPEQESAREPEERRGWPAGFDAEPYAGSDREVDPSVAHDYGFSGARSAQPADRDPGEAGDGS